MAQDYISHAASDHQGSVWAQATTSWALEAWTPLPGMHDIAGSKMWGRLVCYNASVLLIMSKVSRLCNPIICIHVLFRMGRNATGITPKPCVWRAVFLKLPGDWYTGWYSWCPVETNTVVLLLPPITGMSTEPWVQGSSAMISLRLKLALIYRLIKYIGPTACFHAQSPDIKFNHIRFPALLNCLYGV